MNIVTTPLNTEIEINKLDFGNSNEDNRRCKLQKIKMGIYTPPNPNYYHLDTLKTFQTKYKKSKIQSIRKSCHHLALNGDNINNLLKLPKFQEEIKNLNKGRKRIGTTIDSNKNKNVARNLFIGEENN